MSNYNPDQMDITPETAIESALKSVQADRERYNGCIVLLVNNETAKYNTEYHIAGLKLSEAVGLLEWQKFAFLAGMAKSKEPDPEDG